MRGAAAKVDPTPPPHYVRERGKGKALPSSSPASDGLCPLVCCETQTDRGNAAGTANKFGRYKGHQVALGRLPTPRKCGSEAGLGACAGGLGASRSARFQPPRALRCRTLLWIVGQSSSDVGEGRLPRISKESALAGSGEQKFCADMPRSKP